MLGRSFIWQRVVAALYTINTFPTKKTHQDIPMSSQDTQTAMPTRPESAVPASSIPNAVGSIAERLKGYRRIVILTEGAATSGNAKTAISLLRYRSEHIAAVLDGSAASKTCQEIFGTGGDTPIVGSLDQVEDADALFLGIAPAGGKLPPEWHSTISAFLARGLDVVSGLHDFISEVPHMVELAERHSARIIDIRKNNEHSVATHATFPAKNLRIHTVGHDCSVGKMVVALEVDRGLKILGHDSQFIATGQTGIMIDGQGVPVDAVVGDFISGAVESLVVENQHHDMLLVEGQGSLVHPSFSGVTLGLLHGCAPQGLIMCYDAGRSTVKELPHVPLLPLARLVNLYETMASVRCPSKVIGVAINGRSLDEADAARERSRIEAELGLPACDVYRDGADVLVQAVLNYRAEVIA